MQSSSYYVKNIECYSTYKEEAISENILEITKMLFSKRNVIKTLYHFLTKRFLFFIYIFIHYFLQHDKDKLFINLASQ